MRWKKVGGLVAAGLAATLLGIGLAGERGAALRKSTVGMVRLNGRRRLFTGGTLQGYVYSRWPHLYVAAGRALEPILFRVPGVKRRLADTYHGKVLPTELARRLIAIDEPIAVRDLEQIVPYPVARAIILQAPVDVAVIQCPCRASVPNPCLPMDVCMVVGKPYVEFTLEHHPRTSRRLTTEEALQLLADEDRRGHVHAAYFKESVGGRFYAICNCCKCCCGGIDAMVRWGVPMVTSSGYLARRTATECLACGDCAVACPFGAIALDGEGAQVDEERCMGCGVCAGRCPTGALELVRAPHKGVPLDVRALGAGGAQGPSGARA